MRSLRCASMSRALNVAFFPFDIGHHRHPMFLLTLWHALISFILCLARKTAALMEEALREYENILGFAATAIGET